MCSLRSQYADLFTDFPRAPSHESQNLHQWNWSFLFLPSLFWGCVHILQSQISAFYYFISNGCFFYGWCSPAGWAAKLPGWRSNPIVNLVGPHWNLLSPGPIWSNLIRVRKVPTREQARLYTHRCSFIDAGAPIIHASKKLQINARDMTTIQLAVYTCAPSISLQLQQQWEKCTRQWNKIAVLENNIKNSCVGRQGGWV